MDGLILYLLPAIILLGILTSHDDIAKGRIKNIYTGTAIALGIISHGIFWIIGMVDGGYIRSYAIGIVAAALLGILIWNEGLWSAGDAKLYIAFISLIPLTIYKNTSANITIFEMLINVIIPLAGFYLFKTLTNTTLKDKKEALKEVLNPKRLGVSILVIFSIGWISQMILGYFMIQSNYLYNILLIVLLYKIGQKLMEERLVYLLMAVSIIRIFVQQGYILRVSFIAEFVITLILFITATSLFINLSDKFTEKKKASELDVGDSLSEKDKVRLSKYMSIDKTGLSKENIARIKIMVKRGMRQTFDVHETIPFAPFMFLGCIMTIIAQGNVIIFIRNVF